MNYIVQRNAFSAGVAARQVEKKRKEKKREYFYCSEPVFYFTLVLLNQCHKENDIFFLQIDLKTTMFI